MNTHGASQHLQYRRLRAPSEPDGVLATPPVDQWLAPWLTGQPPKLSPWKLSIDRHSLRSRVREQTLEAALAHTTAYRDFNGTRSVAGPWLITGHQPRLFHPGVWIKNFVLDSLAERLHATPINLVVDNDLATEHGVAAPVQTDGGWTKQQVAWGTNQPAIPYEEYRYAGDHMFESFGQRVSKVISPLTQRPLVVPFWKSVCQHVRTERPLGECLAAARHQLESNIGLQTLELPLSRLFDLPAARQWVAAVLEQISALHEIYNRCLADFRQIHGIRSRSHPVPDLGRDDDWLETPFWVWTTTVPHRRPLWVRRAQTWELTSRLDWRVQTSDLESFLNQPERGCKIRPRALMTTLFARTVLGDRFIHGIGGAKYDQLNDAMMAAFLGIEPPPYLTLTATVPLTPRPITARRRQLRETKQKLRELTFNPQRCDENANLELAARKAALLETPSSATRHQELKAVNQAFQPYVEATRQRLLEDQTQLHAALRDDMVLGSRESSFVLFDEEKLPKKLLDLAQKVDKLSIT